MSSDIETSELNRLLEAVKHQYGYDFIDYSESSVRRRINYFMSTRRIETLPLLEEKLINNEQIFLDFITAISVTVTEMFRDPTFYKALREEVMKRLATYPFIKIWVAGCATGEEVYSVAILLKESGLLDRSIIYATDINQHSIITAKEGVYPAENMIKYNLNYINSGGSAGLAKYYTEKFNTVIMDKSLRENIVFSPHNLAVDKSFNEFQLIICRNVLIYFNQRLQNRVINLFYDSLCLFGYLALGSKESLLFSDKRGCFEEKNRKEKIFKKVR